jgi:hypothetical protein
MNSTSTGSNFYLLVSLMMLLLVFAFTVTAGGASSPLSSLRNKASHEFNQHHESDVVPGAPPGGI